MIVILLIRKKYIIYIYMDIILIIIILSLFIIIPFVYLKFNFHNNESFSKILNLYGSLSIIFTVYNIYLTNKSNFYNNINNELNSLNFLLNKITENISNFFINNTNMKYYYDEIINNIGNQDENIRDIDLEEIITNNILVNIDSLINYLDAFKKMNGNNFQLIIIENKLNKILNQFLKSKIFIQNWNKYKKIFALDLTKSYIQTNFNN